MKKSVLCCCLLFATGMAFPQQAAKLHRKAVLVDAHNDILSSAMLEGKDISQRLSGGHSDLVRWKEGGLDVQFFSVWTDRTPRTGAGFFNDANQEIDSLNILILKHPQKVMLAHTYKDVVRGIRQGKLVALIGVEGGHMIEDDLGKLEFLYSRGMRYMTLTWNNSTSWASSAMDETSSSFPIAGKMTTGTTPARAGLSDFGKQVVKKMNELGVIVDLSHVGEQTFYDVLSVTTKPVMLSHSSVWNICPVFRNVKDEQINAVADNGGVICINFYSGFISREYDQRSGWLNGTGKKIIQDSLFGVLKDSAAMRAEWKRFYDSELQKLRPSLGQLVDHIDYIVKLVGDDYVGIGSDYDGVSSVPVGLEDVTTYPQITEELVRRGYSKKSIKKILGGNVMRVMKTNFTK